jgi:DNA (cytosine-5)-methyltransferase 1
MTFNYVSLFSGIGGFEQALNKLGGNCVMASEIDKYANQAYEILYGHPTVGDITKVAAEDVPDHDLLVGGFPCQAFSVAGKRLGFDDTRGTLFFEIARIAKVKRPKAMLMENVKGLISHDKGKTLDTIIQTLGEIGYTVDFEVLNSKYFGVPQNRERIFIVAVRNDLIEPSEWNVLNAQGAKRSDVVAKGKRRIAQLGVKTFNFDWPAQEQVTVRLRDILESDVDERFYLSEEKTAKLVAQLEERYPDDVRATLTPDREEKRQQGRRFKNTDEPAFTLNTQDRHGVALSEPQMIGHVDLKGHDAIKRVYSAEGVSPTLTTMGGGHREPKIAVVKSYGEFKPRTDDLSTCLDANYSSFPDNHGQRTGIAEPGLTTKYRIRKLTPRECFRLQGFPDSEFDKLTANGISNSQLYKMAGNAVTVNVISAIGKRLLPYIAD